MTRALKYILPIALAALSYGCRQERVTYSDAEYVMFADSISVNFVQRDAPAFSVPVASTVACPYDRTFGVEIMDGKSNAVEGLHYTLESNSVTIKAGERRADVVVRANYDALDAGDTLNIALKLVMPDAVRWDLYGDETNVKMLKSCPFTVEDFTGWCVVTSMFLYNYPGLNTSIQRLIYTERQNSEENAVILHNFLYDGYDVRLGFKTGNPAEPWVTLDDGQVLSDEQSVFGTMYGDNKILVSDSPYYHSLYNSCGRYLSLYLYVYVEDLGDMVGVVDPYAYNVLEWVSDEEADRLVREEGMEKKY